MRLGGVALVLVSSCAASTPDQEKIQVPTIPVALRVDRIDGQTLTLGGLRGRIVIAYVFTTWADLSLFEVPKLKKLATKYAAKDLVIVGIALDPSPQMVKIFARTFEIPYYVGTVSDPADFTSPNGPFGKITLIPTSILIDRDGRIIARMDGVWPDGVLEEAVDELIERSHKS